MISPDREGAVATRRGLVAAKWVLGTAAGIAALFFLIVWLLPEAEIDGALLGPAGFVVAFLVGVVSFFSPCILPLLPGYLSFVSGLSGEEVEGQRSRRHVVLGTSLFVLGFATVFTALGASATALGTSLLDNITVLNRVAGVVVIVMGIAFVLPGALAFMERERRPLMARAKPGVAGAFPLGLAFAVGWTPCVGPGLGVILTLGVLDDTVARGALLLFFFSLGFGMWFILGGLATRKMLAASTWMRARAKAIQLVGGIFMVTIGVLLVTDVWDQLLAPVRRLINTFAPPV